MKGYHAEEIASMNNEELDNLINALRAECTDRKVKKREKLFSELYELWMTIEEEGFHVYEDSEYVLNLDDISIE